MSTSLVRKGLELFSDDMGLSGGSLKKKKKGPASLRKEDMMKGIGTNKKGVKKRLNKIRHRETRRPTAKEGTVKSALDAYKRAQPSDCTEDNVQLLLGLSRGNPGTSKTYATILQHSRGRLAKDRVEEEEEPVKETGFTEEDFEKFEKEYMPRKKRDSIL